jgi:hypothetical protein
MKTSELSISKWLNVKSDFSIEKLQGKVIAIHAFQMLCPGCVLHGVPQAQKLFETFSQDHVAVLGLHTVFEHHEAMKEVSLRAFLHEFRVTFPVGIDQLSVGEDIPQTMASFQMRGTPTWLIFDKIGKMKIHAFGQIDDLVLGAEISKLAFENTPTTTNIYNKKGK